MDDHEDHHHHEDVLWDNLFNMDACASVSEFFEWFMVGIDVDIRYC